MKVLKVFLAVILSFLLLCAQGALMGVIACNEAISSDSIAKAVQETDFTNQISQQALDAASRQADENADEKVSEFLNEAMQTDAALIYRAIHRLCHPVSSAGRKLFPLHKTRPSGSDGRKFGRAFRGIRAFHFG